MASHYLQHLLTVPMYRRLPHSLTCACLANGGR